jgi:hypothetical protein
MPRPRRANKSDEWRTETLESGVCRVTFRSRLWVLISSDWHWDSVKCDRDRLAADLAEAKRLNACVLSLGDGFDAMGGKFDPRSNGKYDVRPEFQQGNYYDEIVSQCGQWLEPYREQMALISPGNHESSVRKRMETCLTTRLVERLRVAGSPVRHGGYAGWVLFRANKGRTTALHRLWYHHGFGGGGGTTRGAGQFAQYLAEVDADTIVAGHVHQRTLIEAHRQRITQNGICRTRPVHLVRSSTYKSESVTDGWAVEKGIGARPLGGWWMLLRWTNNDSEIAATFHDRPYEVPEDAGESDSDDDARARGVRSRPKRSKSKPTASRAAKNKRAGNRTPARR